MEQTAPSYARPGLSPDFWKFWAGQTISQLGSSFTMFATPLLIFKLTYSSVNLGIGMAANFVPYLLFGLVIGAWVDRLDRKRMMIAVDLGRAAVIALIPLLSVLHLLDVWQIYLIGFASSTLTIFFEAGEFAAIPSLVGQEDLITANGRIQASYSGAQVAGPLLAGLMLAVVKISWPPRWNAAARVSLILRAVREASSAPAMSSRRIANSSPPKRETVSPPRRHERSRPPIAVSSESPTP